MKSNATKIMFAVVLTTILFGCGNKTNDKQAAGSDQAGLNGESVKVSIVIKDMIPNEDDVVAFEKKLEEEMAKQGTNIDLEVIEPPAGDYATALPLGVRSGEIVADIIYFQGGDRAIAQEGLLEDLTPYIESSTHVKGLMEDANTERLKNYPYLLYLAPSRVPVPVMRKDWIAQLESYDALIADPTIDNYYNFFKEIKDNGLAEFAITSDGSMDRWDSVFNQAFGVSSTIMDVDGKKVFSKATQAEKNKLEFYAKLYKDGLIDPEYMTNEWNNAEQNFYSAKAGLYSTNIGATVKAINDKMVQANGENAELVVLPPAKGVGQGYLAVDTTKENRGFALLSDSKNKDAAWAVLEFMASPGGRMIDKLGIEGIHYEIKDNKIVFTDKFATWWGKIWETTNNFNPEPPLETPIYPQAAVDSLQMAAQYYVKDKNIIIPDDMLPYWDAMTSLYREYAVDIIRGEKDISAFDEFVVKWNEAGGNEFSELLESGQ